MTITSITRIASDCIEKEKTVAKRARRKIEFVSKVPIISSGRKLLASHEDSQTVSGPDMSVGGRGYTVSRITVHIPMRTPEP